MLEQAQAPGRSRRRTRTAGQQPHPASPRPSAVVLSPSPLPSPSPSRAPSPAMRGGPQAHHHLRQQQQQQQLKEADDVRPHHHHHHHQQQQQQRQLFSDIPPARRRRQVFVPPDASPSAGGAGGGGRTPTVKSRTAAPGSEFDRSLPLFKPPPTAAAADEPHSQRELSHPASHAATAAAPPPAQTTGRDGLPSRVYARTHAAEGAAASAPAPRQLFDPRLHDPLRFGGPRVGAGAASVAGTSSTATTAPSTVGSQTVHTASTALSSVHDAGAAGGDRERERRRRREGSERKSAGRSGAGGEEDTRSRSSEGSESLKDRARGKGGDTGVLGSLREQYRGIQALEAHLIDLHRRLARDESLILSSGLRLGPGMADGGWAELRARHLALAHAHHDFLTAALDPRLPASLHALPAKYNIAARLWHNAFHLLIERLRAAWLAPAAAATGALSRDAVGAATLLPSSAATSTTTTTAAAAATGATHDASARALEHLTDYILDAYQFYTTVLDQPALAPLRPAWLEALGDLARYKMAVASHVAASTAAAAPPPARFARIDDASSDDEGEGEGLTAAAAPPPAGGSIGKAVADGWDVSERETWRTTAGEWYARGVGDRPGEGRLHHRLALVSRDAKGEESRALYHFAKSLITNNPFPASRESLLPLFDSALQAARLAPDASAADLFVRLHGMLFTRIALDDFDAVFARFFERLEEEDRRASESSAGSGGGGRDGGRPPKGQAQRQPRLESADWCIMGVVNIAACLQYGAEDGLLRRAGQQQQQQGDDARRPGKRDAPAPAGNGMVATQDKDPQAILLHGGGSDEGGSDSSDIRPLQHTAGAAPAAAVDDDNDDESLPLPFRLALRLAFALLAFVLAHPVRRDALAHAVVNPYLGLLLTFLATVAKQPAQRALVERHVPWAALVRFFNDAVPRKVELRLDVPAKLGAGGPLPEDWCLRGMEWVGRRVYERGFWKTKPPPSSSSTSSSSAPAAPDGPRTAPPIASEMDVLALSLEHAHLAAAAPGEGIVDDGRAGAGAVDLALRRWRRVAWARAVLLKAVPGLEVDELASDPAGVAAGAPRKVHVDPAGPLRAKMDGWEAERQAQPAAERARTAPARAAAGEEDEDEDGGTTASDDDDDSDGGELDPELRALKAQRRELRAILRAGRRPSKAVIGPRPPPGGRSKSSAVAALPPVLSGYTVLVFDTNVVLSCLGLFTAVVDSGRWTAMLPLPVITELDGLSHQPPPLGPHAQEALAFVGARMRTHARSLKVQTSRGNYLADLTLRAEDVSFAFAPPAAAGAGADEPERARNMDDLILRAAVASQQHFVDRTAALGVSAGATADDKARAAKVVLLTNDRNLRLRAKAQGVAAVDEKQTRRLLGLTKDGMPLPSAAVAGG